MPDQTVTFTEQAIRNIGNMQQRLIEVERQYGSASQEHRDMLWSAFVALVQTIRIGGRVMAEDDLSLLVDSFITMGVIFSPKRNGDNRDPLLGEWSCHS